MIHPLLIAWFQCYNYFIYQSQRNHHFFEPARVCFAEVIVQTKFYFLIKTKRIGFMDCMLDKEII